MAMSKVTARRTRYYRWVFRLYGGYLIAFAVAVVLLLASITDANAGMPALFLGGVLLATAIPACVINAVLAGFSLVRREPYRPAMIGTIIASCLIVWALHGIFLTYVELLWKILTVPGFLGHLR
jgi:hypothetical protein